MALSHGPLSWPSLMTLSHDPIPLTDFGSIFFSLKRSVQAEHAGILVERVFGWPSPQFASLGTLARKSSPHFSSLGTQPRKSSPQFASLGTQLLGQNRLKLTRYLIA